MLHDLAVRIDWRIVRTMAMVFAAALVYFGLLVAIAVLVLLHSGPS